MQPSCGPWLHPHARTGQAEEGGEAYDEVEELTAHFEMAAAEAVRVEGLIPSSVTEGNRVLVNRVPRGVAGVSTPWNWPYTMPGEIVAPALASGNTVVLAPTRTTSMCAVALATVIAEADLPPRTFNLVTGPGAVVGDEVASNPGVSTVGFIGSIATGHRVAERAAGKEFLLEMGGNGPRVVLEDADLDAAVEAMPTACFPNACQSCTAGERVLVQERVLDDYVVRLTAAFAERIRLGDPSTTPRRWGRSRTPVADKTERHVGDAAELGAWIVTGQARAAVRQRSFLEATVVDACS